MSDPTKPPVLSPPTFRWGQGSTSTIVPSPAMYVGTDAEGNLTIPVGPAGVDAVPPPTPSAEVVELVPPTFMWGTGHPTPMAPIPIMLVGVKDGNPYIINVDMGVTDGSEAKPGEIGEYLVSVNIDGIQLLTETPAAICQIELTPGDWDVWGSIDFLPDSNKSPNMICASVSPYPDALPTDEDLYTAIGIMTMFWTPALTSGERQVLMTGQCRANITEPLILYCVGQTAFAGGGTVLAKGYISARRVR